MRPPWTRGSSLHVRTQQQLGHWGTETGSSNRKETPIWQQPVRVVDQTPGLFTIQEVIVFFFFFWCLYLTSYGPVRWRRFDSAGPVVFQHSYAPLELRVRSPRLCVRSRAPLRPALRPAPRETRGSAGFRASEASEARANDVKCAVISPWMVSAGTWNEWAFQYHHRCEALAPGHRSEAYFDFVRVRPAEAGSEDLRRPRQWVRPTA